MIINHNISALNTHRQMGANDNNVQESLEKLSSGMKINKAGDDAAGLAISEKMRGQIRGLDMAEKNAQDGISLVQTAEGALNETQDILQRMRELSVQSANDSNTETDREELQKEVDQLANALNDISDDTEFNEQKLFEDGDFEATFHVGANEEQNLEIEIGEMNAEELGVSGNDGEENGNGDGIDISEQEAADSAIETIQGAIDDVSAERSKLGAVQNRLDHTINNLGTSSENLTAAESRIRDTDMAEEMMDFTKDNILSQSSQAMLAQAQQNPQGVLQLLE